MVNLRSILTGVLTFCIHCICVSKSLSSNFKSKKLSSPQGQSAV